MTHGGEAVCYDYYRAPPVEGVEIFDYGTFVVGVERVGGFVEEYEIGIFMPESSEW